MESSTAGILSACSFSTSRQSFRLSGERRGSALILNENRQRVALTSTESLGEAPLRRRRKVSEERAASRERTTHLGRCRHRLRNLHTPLRYRRDLELGARREDQLSALRKRFPSSPPQTHFVQRPSITVEQHLHRRLNNLLRLVLLQVLVALWSETLEGAAEKGLSEVVAVAGCERRGGVGGAEEVDVGEESVG